MNVNASTELACRPEQAIAEVRTSRLLSDVAQPCGDVRELDSANLLAGSTCIAIRHGGERYWLRATRQGKLLLTK